MHNVFSMGKKQIVMGCLVVYAYMTLNTASVVETETKQMNLLLAYCTYTTSLLISG